MPALRFRPLIRSPIIWSATAAAILLALLLREAGYGDLSCYVNYSRSEHLLTQSDSTRLPLSAAEVRRQHQWQTLALPGHGELTVYYAETRHSPWGRWYPLVKTGTTTTSRPFFVARGNDRVLSGEVDWQIDQTIVGPISARGYSAKATEDTPKQFIESVREELEKSRLPR